MSSTAYLENDFKIETIVDAIEILKHAPDLSAEYNTLKILQHLLRAREHTEEFFGDLERLKEFMVFLFNRRFGWSDSDQNQGRASSPSKTKRFSIEDEAKHKKAVNDVADEFLYFLKEQPITSALLSAIGICAAKSLSSNKPVVRQQTLKHFFEWIRHQIQLDLHIQEKIEVNFGQIKDIITFGITDVWSAIRKACSIGLSAIAEDLTLEQLDSLFRDFQSICLAEITAQIQLPPTMELFSPRHRRTSSGSSLAVNKVSWQSKEGAMLGIAIIIRAFDLGPAPIQLTDLSDTSTDSDTFGFTSGFVLKRRHETYNELPSFISENIRTVLYKMLAHPQLSIREYAIRTFEAVLTRSKHRDILSTFAEVVTRLNSKFESGSVTVKTNIGQTNNLSSPTVELIASDNRPVNKVDYFLDAYEAESLLGVCGSLIKSMSASEANFFHLPAEKWTSYFATFVFYLGHPASTVRQECSAVFRKLLSKHPYPSVVKLILQTLTQDWDLSAMTAEPTVSLSWEEKEGRLLAYELILKFLLNNHVLYIFPFTQMRSPKGYPIQPSPQTAFSRLGSENTTTSPPRDPSKSPLRRSSSAQEIHGIPVQQYQQYQSPKPISKQATAPNVLRSVPIPHRLPAVRRLVPPSLNSPSSSNGLPHKRSSQVSGSLIDLLSENFQLSASPTLTRKLQSVTFKTKEIKDILRTILHQVAECFKKDARWELVRMALQVLPFVTETAFFVDVDILHNIWNDYIRVSNAKEPFCFVACKSLVIVLRKMVTLEEKQMKIPDKYWANSADKDRVFQLIENVKPMISSFASNILELLSPSVESLKLRVTVTELLFMLYTFWAPQLNLPTDKRRKVLHSIITNLIDFSSPSFSQKLKRSAVPHALLSSIHPFLGRFLLTCDPHGMITAVPALVDMILHNDDPEIQVSLLEAISKVYTAVSSWDQIKAGDTYFEAMRDSLALLQPKQFQQASDYVAFKLVQLMETKTLETVIIKKVLDALYTVCCVWNDLRHFPRIAQYIVTSMNQERFISDLSQKQLSSSSLQILSNDIVPSEEDDVHGEGETLEDTSTISVSLSAADEGSVLDSWDDEGDLNVRKNIAEFAQFLKRISQEFAQGKTATINTTTEARKCLGMDTSCKGVTYQEKIQTIPESGRHVINWYVAELPG